MKLFFENRISESYSDSEIEKVLMKITDNFSDKDGSVETSYENEKDSARDILKKHYKVVEVSDGRRSSSETMSWVIAYSNPKN